ncbi:hypothetical protein [Clostridium paraputrificum]|uniref:hypothetical protein n=1 Tax=Clostridium paraputrificum TaxID=29363 RepID=UPI00374E8177
MENLFNASEISKKIGMNKSKVLSLIKDGVLPTTKEKKVRFKGNYVTVKYVSEKDINIFIQSDIYKKYIEKKEKRKLKEIERSIKLNEEIEERRIERDREIKEFIRNNGGITEELLGKVGYSYNKRAKASEDIEERREFYKCKEMILNEFKPVEIHLNKRHIRYFDYPDDEYVDYLDRSMYEVEKDVYDVLELYRIGEYTFHKPIDRLDEFEKSDYKNVNGLKVKEIILENKPYNFDDLLSLDICDYVLEELRHGQTLLITHNT